jgi:FkbM family methyltransferase
MYLSIKISAKNSVRRLIYQWYSFYVNKLRSKVPVYDLQTIELVKTLPKDCICVDVGANEGQILQYLYNHCSAGKIYAIEPIHHLAKYLKRKYKRATVYQVALSEQEGEMEFFYMPNRPALSGLSVRNLEEQKQEKLIVPVKTINNLFKNVPVGFIKIDVEGAEYQVLKGASDILRTYKPLIVFESGHGGMEYFNQTPESLYELLEQANYKISTLKYYLEKREALSFAAFVYHYKHAYDYQYVAYACNMA